VDIWEGERDEEMMRINKRRRRRQNLHSCQEEEAPMNFKGHQKIG
jgi:hypothetical protein